MALLSVYFLLLLCSVSPLLSYGSHCPRGSYCPAGTDCSSNSTSCVEGVCEATSDRPCIDEVLIEFGDSSYTVDENAGEVEIELNLDAAIECCTIRVSVKIADETAEGGIDYDAPEYELVTFPAGKTTASFRVTIKEDVLLEGDETFTATIYELSVPYGITLGTLRTTTVTIRDNDNAILTFSRPTYRVDENNGQVLPELILNVPATVTFTVQIESSNVDLSDCDEFERTIYTANFPNGTTRVTVPISISDDDVHEEDESFYITIIDPHVDRVAVGVLSRAEVVIVNDDNEITANFDKRIYRVQEHQGSVSPKIVLTEPSPCCFILHAQLSDVTARGKEVDYGYDPSNIYNYTFHAGSICASPDIDIAINDDMISEDEESFHIRIIPNTLPFGVISGGPALILINDNDNAIWFRFGSYEISEDESKVWVELLLEGKATSDLPIQISSTDGTATGGSDYDSGPYDVIITRGSTRKFFSIDILDDDVYEGPEDFVITITTLPLGLVRGDPYKTTITIKDDEYIVEFKQPEYYVDEGESIKLELELSRALPKTITVQLQFSPILPTTNSDYYPPPRSVTFPRGVTEASVNFRTREDSTIEDKFESVGVVVKHPSITNGTADRETVITIVDDDDITIKFDRDEYISTESSPKKAKLVISRSATKTFTPIIDQVDCGTAVGGTDYEIQDYRTNTTFVKSGKTYVELTTKPKDDDIVECDKKYCLVLISDLLPERVIAISPSVCDIIIRDDDKTTVTRVDEVISFSKALDRAIDIDVTYYTGLPQTLTLAPESKQVTIDSSRLTRIQRITIKIPCCFRRDQFLIRAPRTYLVFERC